jgi:hypothetical protein
MILQQMPSSTMKSMIRKDATLIPLDLTIGVQELSPSLSGEQVVAKQSGSVGSIAFVVYAASMDNSLRQLNVIPIYYRDAISLGLSMKRVR